MNAVLDRAKSAEGWKLIPLKELGTWTGGGTPSKSKPEFWTNGTIPWVSPKDMKTNRITESQDQITEAAIEGSATKLIPAQSVLVVTRSGILSHTLPVAVTALPVAVNQDLKALTPNEAALPDYIAWALRCFAREILNTCSKQGTTVSSIETKALQAFEIPVAPLEKQRDIVAEIEKQFSRLDEAVTNLHRVKANLTRYKAAVLKAAVEGRLVETEAELARREGRTYETGEQLLQRILETHRSQWKGKGKYREPRAPNDVEAPELPKGWAYVGIDQLVPPSPESMKTGPFGSLLKKHEHQAQGVPVLGIENIETMRFVAGSKIHVSLEKAAELSGYAVTAGDVLISRSGTVGVVCVVPEGLGEARISTNLIKVSLAREGVLPTLFVMVVNGSPFVLNQISELCKGSTRTFLNQTILRQLKLPCPPLIEQQRIAAEVERQLSLVHNLEAQFDRNLALVTRLRKSVLGQAFSSRNNRISTSEQISND